MKAFAYFNLDSLNEFDQVELCEIIFFADATTLNAAAQNLLRATAESDQLGVVFNQVIFMKSCAYPISDRLQENKPMVLNEITLTADSKSIRYVAEHLMIAADEMIRLGEHYDHLHMKGNCPVWDEEWPDIIVKKHSMNSFCNIAEEVGQH